MSKQPLVALVSMCAMLAVTACGGGEETAAPAAGGGEEAAPAGGAGEMIDPASITDGGNVSGSIAFTGTAPEADAIQMSADPYCLSQHADPVMAQRVVVNDNGTLNNAFVYVKEGLEGMQFTTPATAATLEQTGCLYSPHVLGVQVGQTITVVNNDDTLHNVNAQPANNDGFNFAQPVRGMTSEVTFDNPEIGIPAKCDVHPWMSSYVHVVSNPYFAVSGSDGSFSLSNLPPGDYVIAAWHETLGEQTQNVTVTTGGTAEVSFSFGS